MKIETAIKTFGTGYAVKVTVAERNAEPQTIINYATPTLAAAIDAATAALRDLRPADAAPQAAPETAPAQVQSLAYETTYDRKTGLFDTKLIRKTAPAGTDAADLRRERREDPYWR